MLKIHMIVFVVLALSGCSQEQPVQKSAQKTPVHQESTQAVNEKKAAEHTLVFFINPDGAPCQMQGKILSEMSGELDGKVVIRPVQTTVQTDLDIFYAYGIRALPTLMLADNNGKEIKRLPPGVHPAETIRNLVSQISVR